MSKSKTTEQFIADARKVHGDKYDYSKVKYVDTHSAVDIVCPIHGIFSQKAISHLRGSSCPICANKRKRLCGVGINDVMFICDDNCHKYWNRMIKRCYYKDRHNNIMYPDCCVCQSWHKLSEFKIWFDQHYVKGWELDKDILLKGNKIYSPEICCFVPQEINKMFTKREAKRGSLPIGVSKTNSFTSPYRAALQCGGVQKRIGSFSTIEKAFHAYKQAKEMRIKELANKYKDQLEPRVYQALYNYQVEITD